MVEKALKLHASKHVWTVYILCITSLAVHVRLTIFVRICVICSINPLLMHLDAHLFIMTRALGKSHLIQFTVRQYHFFWYERLVCT